MRWLLPGEYERDAPATGPQLALEVVGIVRTGADLSAFDGSDVAALLVTGPAIWRAVEDEAFLGFTGIAVQAADADAARAAIEAAFPGRVVQHRARNERRRSPAHPRRVRLRGERGTGLRRADGVGGVDLRRAGHRPSGAPGVDSLPVLRALGWSQHEVGRAAVGRGAIIGVLGGVIARCRRHRALDVDARRRRSVAPSWSASHLDAVVMGIGLPVVVLLAAAAAWLPVRRLARLRRRPLGRFVLAGGAGRRATAPWPRRHRHGRQRRTWGYRPARSEPP